MILSCINRLFSKKRIIFFIIFLSLLSQLTIISHSHEINQKKTQITFLVIYSFLENPNCCICELQKINQFWSDENKLIIRITVKDVKIDIARKSISLISFISYPGLSPPKK